MANPNPYQARQRKRRRGKAGTLAQTQQVLWRAIVEAETVLDDAEGNNQILQAYHALAQWIETHGYRVAGPPREVFYGSVERGDLIAEVQFPVGKS